MELSNKVVLTAALTGAVTPKSINDAIPMTPEEISEDAYRVWQAGASVVHFHMRDDEGLGTMDKERFKKTMELLRGNHPDCDVVINFTTGVLGAAMGLGIMVGLNLGPMSMAAAGGDWAVGLRNLWPLALVGIIMTVVCMVGPKVAPAGAGMENMDEAALASNTARYKKALLLPLTWIATACVVIASWFNQAFNDMTPGYLALDPPVGLGLGAAGAGSIASLAQIGNIVGCLVVGIIVERVFKGKARPALMVAFAAMAVGAGLLLVPGVNTSQTMLTVAMMITVFFLGWINATALGWVAKNYPAEITGKLGGMAQGIGIFGGLAGVAAGSAALHATGYYVVSTLIMVAVAIVGIGVAFFMQTHKHQGVDADSKADQAVA